MLGLLRMFCSLIGHRRWNRQVLGARRIFARISPNLSEKFLCGELL